MLDKKLVDISTNLFFVVLTFQKFCENWDILYEKQLY